MTVLEKLKSLLDEQYISEDGDEYNIELKPGLTDKQIEHLSERFPSGKIPEDIRELLKFTAGFEFYGLDEVTFDGIGVFGFEELFPDSVQLAGDGFGNFWIADVDKKGNWGNIFYVCHDPAVTVKHSENLTQFIEHINEFGKYGNKSHLDIIHERVVMDIWKKNNEIITLETARQSSDPVLRDFAECLPENYVLIDLRNAPNRKGFAWGKSASVVRHDTELIWGLEKQLKRGFLSKLFGSR